VSSGHSHTAGSNRRRLFVALGLSLLVIVVMIVPRAWMLMREVIAILLETTPSNVDLEQVRAQWLNKSFVLSARVVAKAEALAADAGPIQIEPEGNALGGACDARLGDPGKLPAHAVRWGT
jgi:Co/Zn/Cd efflux system component